MDRPLPRTVHHPKSTREERIEMRTRRRSTGPDRLTIEGVYLRCEGLCEGCSEELRGERGVQHHAHHRRPRRMGGSQLPETNGIENILMLDADCHSYVESQRTWAYRYGFLVRQDDVPALVPVLLHAVPGGEALEVPVRSASGWVLLTDDGGYRIVDEVPEVFGAAS